MDKIKKKKIITILFIAFLLLVSLGAYINYYTYYVEESFGILGNKDFNIILKDEDIADYSYIFAEPFSLWKNSERQKLAEYMKEKNLKIRSGRYKIHQKDRFEKVLKTLEFDKIE